MSGIVNIGNLNALSKFESTISSYKQDTAFESRALLLFTGLGLDMLYWYMF